MPIEPFMQRALLTALLLGPLCGFIGVFVTARRMSFFSDTIAHAALAGVALGFWLGVKDPTLPMILFSLFVALLILWLKERTDLLNDTIMALLLSSSVAFGMVVLTLLKGFRNELDRFLFGDIFSVGWNEVGVALGVFLVVCGALFWRLNSLALLTAHEDLAHVSGVPVGWLNRGFVLLLTVTVALSIRLLGIVLVTSLVVIPPATARNLARSLRQQILFSLLLGTLGAVGGVALSYPLDLPGGPCITLTLAAFFLVSLGFSRIFRRGVVVEGASNSR
jgi:ABC-type Mn2+/Zn2+ transport system permease subunit